jgi:uncharacterized protein
VIVDSVGVELPGSSARPFEASLLAERGKTAFGNLTCESQREASNPLENGTNKGALMPSLPACVAVNTGRRPRRSTMAAVIGASLVWLRPVSGHAESCGSPYVGVGQIQGAGEVSEYDGGSLAVEATVSADFRGGQGAFGQLHIVFVQDVPADSDPKTSDGLAIKVNPEIQSTFELRAFDPGTRIRATGRVEEVSGETQLVAEAVQVCAINAAPVAVDITLPINPEHFEGMLVRFVDALQVSGTQAFAEYGELNLISGGLARAYTDRFPPDPLNFKNYEVSVNARSLVLDDGFEERYRPTRLETETLRLGASLSGTLSGVVRPGTVEGPFRIEPTALPRFSKADAPGLLPQRNEPSVRVVSANLHNLFKDGGPGSMCYPTLDATSCRGFDSLDDRLRQRTHLALMLSRLDADIVVATEVQNDFGATQTPTWEQFIEDLNALDTLQCDRYEAVVPDVFLGGDAIAVALAYCADRVDLLAAQWPTEEWLGTLTSQEQGYQGIGASRIPLAGTFRQRSTGWELTVVGNHWKSRAPGSLEGECAGRGECDQSDGQGYWAAARERAALGLLQWLKQFSAPIVLAGDFNAYPMEHSTQTLVAAGYEPLISRTANEEQFSYAYEARVGYLDQIYLSREWLDKVLLFESLQGNAEGFGLDDLVYSDHNPVITDLQGATTSHCDCSAPGAMLGTFGNDVIIGTPGDDVLCGLAGDDVLLGLGGDDCVDGGWGEDWHVAVRPMVGPSPLDSPNEHYVEEPLPKPDRCSD